MSDYDSLRSAASQLSEAWKLEIERRSQEIDDGSVETESWEEVRARLIARHGVKDTDEISRP